MNSMCCSVFFLKQKTAYEMRISDWSSDVCSSDLPAASSRSTVTVHRASALLQSAVSTRVLQRMCRSMPKIGRASCRGRVCQYVEISVVAVELKKKETDTQR